MQRQVTRPRMFDFLANVSSDTYIFATLGSIVFAALLFLRGQREQAVFVGEWAPTLLIMGLFYKFLRHSREPGM